VTAATPANMTSALSSHAAAVVSAERNTYPASLSVSWGTAPANALRVAVVNVDRTTYWGAPIDVSKGAEFVVTAPTGNTTGGSKNIAIENPTNPSAERPRITVRVRNASGAPMATLNFGTAYKLAAVTKPADGFSVAIDFQYDGTNWIEASRASDVPN
jgi:hypothetical protein